MVTAPNTTWGTGFRPALGASAGIALALLLAACAGRSPPTAAAKTVPVRVSLRDIAEVVGSYRNHNSPDLWFGGAELAGTIGPTDMRIFPDGSGNWTMINWVSYIGYGPNEPARSPPFPDPIRHTGKFAVRDGLLWATEGGNESRFVAYRVDAAAFETPDQGYHASTSLRPDSPPPAPSPPPPKRRTGSVLILIPFEMQEQFESKGAAFDGYQFNLFDRWRTGTPANAVPVPTPSPELTAYENELTRISMEATDADGDDATITMVEGPLHGALGETWDRPGQLIRLYQPQPGYRGPDRIRFTASDGRGTSAPAEIRLQVVAREKPPAN